MPTTAATPDGTAASPVTGRASPSDLECLPHAASATTAIAARIVARPRIKSGAPRVAAAAVHAAHHPLRHARDHLDLLLLHRDLDVDVLARHVGRAVVDHAG